MTIVIHGVEVLAVQLHCGPDAVTATERVTLGPGLLGMLTVVRLSWKEQFVPCCTVNVWPAMVSVPVLTFVGFDATENVTDPLPFPIAPEVTVIHGVLLVALHVHPFTVDTLTVGAGPPLGVAE